MSTGTSQSYVHLCGGGMMTITYGPTTVDHVWPETIGIDCWCIFCEEGPLLTLRAATSVEIAEMELTLTLQEDPPL